METATAPPLPGSSPDEMFPVLTREQQARVLAHGQLRTVESGETDGNSWLLQEITTRLPGRVDPGAISFGSISDLSSAFRRAEAAHGEHEKRTGGQRDENWPDWYAKYMAAEQTGEELPQ